MTDTNREENRGRQQDKQQGGAKSAGQVARGAKPIRVVLVDDSKLTRERAAALLSSLDGIAVVGEAADVQQGLALIREAKPDVIVLDIDLPSGSGIDMLRTIKREAEAAVVIMLTSYDEPKLRERCGELGANYYFHKLTEFEKMLRVCEQLAEEGALPYKAQAYQERLEALVKERTAELISANETLKSEIAERKNTEERLREQAGLLDLAHDAIIVRDLQDKILYWNGGAERVYGWSAEEALGLKASELLHEDAGDSAEIARAVLEKDEWHGELTHVTKARNNVLVETRLTLVRDPQGQPKSVLAINADITERKKLEAQFLRVQRMESIGTLASGIAHDLNNVLAPIMMGCQLLRECEGERDKQQMLDLISTSVQRGADLVKQVLAFCRGVEGRRMELRAKSIIQEVDHITRETFPKSIRFETKIARDLWTVIADPTQLHQVLLNLCVNARDAMPNGGLLKLNAENVMLDNQYTPMTREGKPRPYVVISVEDTGVGIPVEMREKVFDPFFTTKEVGKGTGLGLSTSLAIVKSHGGFINLYSEPGKGTIFKVYFPALTDSNGTTLQAREAQLPRGKGEIVLLVDDETAIRTVTKQTLQTFGYNVITASDGMEALDLFMDRGGEVDVLLTDMMMPHMDGPTTIQTLRKINPHLKVIAASGLSVEAHLTKGLNDAVTAFLAKPYTAETLLKTLAQVLREPK